MKITGLPAAIAMNVPIIMLIDPINEPKIKPYNEAKTSAKAKNPPETPIIGNVGIILNIKYKAEKTAINIKVFV
jgi:hypothetical protein